MLVLRGVILGAFVVCTFASGVPVLMYHEIRTPNISDTALRRDLSCSPDQFNQHLDWIEKQEYITITSGQLLRIPLSKKSIMLTFDDGRKSHYEAASLLHQRGMVGVFYINSASIGTPEHLTRSQIIEMSRMGMEIGSHTVTHPDLRRLSRARLLVELATSKKQLQRLIYQPVNSLAYPSGAYDQGVISAAIRSGYTSARTTDRGVFKGRDPFRVPVIRIHPTTTTRDLARMVMKGYNK